jgi:DNA polymerase-3 subunit chi
VTEIAFHFGAPDKALYSCRLLRKAAGAGSRVIAIAEPEMLAELDAKLWALSPTDFVPHCLVSTDASVRRKTPVVLATDLMPNLGDRDVLVNLASATPKGFEAFERLIEVVSTDPADRMAARERWKFYVQRGYDITRHDLSLKQSE